MAGTIASTLRRFPSCGDPRHLARIDRRGRRHEKNVFPSHPEAMKTMYRAHHIVTVGDGYRQNYLAAR